MYGLALKSNLTHLHMHTVQPMRKHTYATHTTHKYLHT